MHCWPVLAPPALATRYVPRPDDAARWTYDAPSRICCLAQEVHRKGVFPGRAAQPLVTASCPGVTQSFMAVSPTFSILSDWVNTQWQNGGETHYTHEKILRPHGEFKTHYAASSHGISSCRGGTASNWWVLSSVPY